MCLGDKNFGEWLHFCTVSLKTRFLKTRKMPVLDKDSESLMNHSTTMNNHCTHLEKFSFSSSSFRFDHAVDLRHTIDRSDAWHQRGQQEVDRRRDE